jgi:hypothetical protein
MPITNRRSRQGFPTTCDSCGQIDHLRINGVDVPLVEAELNHRYPDRVAVIDIKIALGLSTSVDPDSLWWRGLRRVTMPSKGVGSCRTG